MTTKPVAGTTYRAVYKGLTSATAVRSPAITPCTVTVASVVSVKARPVRVRRRTAVRLAGTAVPAARQLGAAAPRITLRVERRAGPRWVKAAQRRLRPQADGTVAWSWRPGRPGSYRVRAIVAATPDLLAGKSRWESFEVR